MTHLLTLAIKQDNMDFLEAYMDMETLQSFLSLVFLSAIVLGITELVIHHYYKKIRNKGERSMTLFSLESKL